ncbi:lipocalin family protein [Flavobacteriaceae bacterium]|jgi:hypothetical protein|nr:lipocalin family protein [Flavobacteriaceae bacterium]|tara:strand:+ start:260 stop:652 length:393 start_codon:yes stop_codon:yes gene_type:complete
MKNLFYLFLAVTLFSCSSDDSNSNNASNNSIVGNWQLNQINEGDGLETFNEYFVWELYSDGTGFSRYREDGTGTLVSFSLIWEITSDNILRISRDGGQDWEEEEILNQTSSELWTYSLELVEELRYLKIP